MAYIVKSGDSLGAIAAQLGVADWRDLFIGEVLAGDTNPRDLPVGAVIYTPEEGAGGTPGPAAEDGSDAPAVESRSDLEGSRQIRVEDPGESVATAAAPAGVLSAEEQARGGIGGGGVDPETQLTILTGRRMEWIFDDQSGKWYVSYGMPRSDRSMIFEADPDQMDALFGPGQRPVSFSTQRLSTVLNAEGNTFAGNIGEMEGEGNFEEEVEKAKALALDDGVLPEWAETDGAAMDIVYIAQAEDKGDDWVLAQLTKLNSFKARFPGFETLKSQGNLTDAEAVTGFLEFEAGTQAAMLANGFDPNGVTPEVVGGLLNKGYTLETTVDTVSTFKRMTDFAPALEAFNQVLASQGLEGITSQQEYFEFLKGRAPAETYQLYEASSVQEAAVAAGLGDLFTAGDAIQTALATEQTLQTSTEGFRQAANLLLRLRNEVDIGKFDLDVDELIDISLKQPLRSGRTEAEVTESINRAVATAQGALQARAKPFTGFTSRGTPQAASLANLRQTS